MEIKTTLEGIDDGEYVHVSGERCAVCARRFGSSGGPELAIAFGGSPFHIGACFALIVQTEMAKRKLRDWK